MFPLIPKATIFKDPDYSLVKLSPQAEWISSIYSTHDKKQLRIQKLNNEEECLTLCEEGYFSDYWWIHTNQHILYLKSSEQYGTELICYSLLENKKTSLCKGAFIKWVEAIPNSAKAIVCLTDKNSKNYKLYIADATTNQFELFYYDAEFSDYIIDTKGDVRFGIRINQDGGEIVDLSHSTVAHQWKSIYQFNQHDMMLMHRFNELKPRLSAKSLYFVSSQSSHCAQLFAYHLQTSQLSVLAQDEKADIIKFIWHPNTHAVIACHSEHSYIKWFGLKSDIEQHLLLLTKFKNNHFHIVSQSMDNQHWIIAHHSDTKPIQYSHYDLATQQLVPLFQENIKHYRSNTETIWLKAKDGLDLHALFTKASTQSSTQSQAPLVALIHGGPHSRDFWGWQPVHQFLSNRGYHVLSLNFRGSIGFGKAHLEAGNGEWGGKILEDIKQSVEYFLALQSVDPAKIAIMGTSFGGYAAMMSLIKYPDFYRCAVDLMGPVDLNALIAQLPPEWKNNHALINKIFNCDVASDEGKKQLQEISPLKHYHKIKKPLLMGHGKRDVIVRYTETVKFIEKLSHQDIPVSGVLFNQEGHQLNNANNRIFWYGCVERFLNKWLKGASEDSALVLNQNIEIIKDDFNILSDTQAEKLSETI
ncbi:alpha/beta fold hydrolase [Candidatus Berkiella cookevillensis]|uniref:Alpha/beta fold hydrolase n=1 Tax=Candidatus Berkiella cookevillensis TaxID=437022 RepID=A0A0Q9YT81_9GAMM|nr:alpha/beta fold hydrolase [Candidatus Berkiella cookevillensis]MCS5708849.1 alpha/beta fold hydrolase [Candidatus Berkiella cookevillensis]